MTDLEALEAKVRSLENETRQLRATLRDKYAACICDHSIPASRNAADAASAPISSYVLSMRPNGCMPAPMITTSDMVVIPELVRSRMPPHHGRRRGEHKV